MTTKLTPAEKEARALKCELRELRALHYDLDLRVLYIERCVGIEGVFRARLEASGKEAREARRRRDGRPGRHATRLR